MQKHIRLILVLGFLAGVSACSNCGDECADPPTKARTVYLPEENGEAVAIPPGEGYLPTEGRGYLNGADDDNGVEPPPNNGNQNFGRRY